MRGSTRVSFHYANDYRASVPSGAPAGRPVALSSPVSADSSDMTAIDSGSVLQMVDASSASLLQELNEKLRRRHWWPLFATLFIVWLWRGGHG